MLIRFPIAVTSYIITILDRIATLYIVTILYTVTIQYIIVTFVNLYIIYIFSKLSKVGNNKST
jgi:hypothetical protein